MLTDAMIRDAIGVIIILTYVYLLATHATIDPALSGLAMIAFGYFFKGVPASYIIGKPKEIVSSAPVIIPLVLVMLFLFGSNAKADIFNPISPSNPKATVTTPLIDTGNILADATSVINYLGVQEGYAYNFELHQWDVVSGATIITYAPWNLDLGIAMLDTDGVAATIDWNVGSFLPVTNVPVMQYFSYLYLTGGVGAEENSSSNWKIAPIVGAKFKFSF